MLDTLSKIIGTALLKLGAFAAFVSSNELETVAWERITFYLADLRESDQNQMLKTLLFSLSSGTDEVNLGELASDIYTAAWVEVRLDRNRLLQCWRYVPTVNLDTLPEFRSRGELACAFYGEEVGKLNVAFSYVGDTDFCEHRLRYDATLLLPETIDDTIALPDALQNVIVQDILTEIVVSVQVNFVSQNADDPNLGLKVKLLEQIRADASARREEWFLKWNNFKQSANRSQRGMKFPRVIQRVGF